MLAEGSRRNRSGTRRARRRCRPAAASTARRRTSLTTTSCVCPPLMSRTALLRVSLSLFLVRLTLCCHYINHCGYSVSKAFAFYDLPFGRHAFLTTGILLHLSFLLEVSIIQTLSLPMMDPLEKSVSWHFRKLKPSSRKQNTEEIQNIYSCSAYYSTVRITISNAFSKELCI